MLALTVRNKRIGRLRLLIASLCTSVLLGACEETISPDPNLVALSISPSFVTLEVGGTQQFTVWGTLTNGSTVDVPVNFTATSGSITSSGLYTATAPGNHQVIATGPGGVFTTATVTVSTIAPVLTGVRLTPDTMRLQTGSSGQFLAAGLFNDGVNRPIPITFSATGGVVSPTTGLYVAGGSPGVFRAIAQATTGQSDTSVIILTSIAPPPPTLVSISLTPWTATLQVGGVQAFSVTGLFSNNTTQNLTSQSTFSANGGTVTALGVYTAPNTPGVYQIIASTQGLSASATVTVAPALLGITISPSNQILTFGATQQFQVTGQFSNGTADLTSQASYSAAGGSITQLGFYTAGNTAGQFQVIASFHGFTATANVTVQAPVSTQLVAISIAPTSFSLAAGGTQQLTVTGHYANGSTQNHTAAAAYTQTGGTTTAGGLYTAGTTAGTFTVQASFGGFNATANITITTAPPPPPVLQSITISPATVTLQAGGTRQFIVTGNYSSGNPQTHTTQATYTVTGGTITSGGLYTAGSTAGTFTVQASYGGHTAAATITITASAPTLTSISITPTPVSLNAGATQQFIVTGNYNSGGPQTHTTQATYTATGGTITAGGLYSAGTTAGTFTVQASYNGFNATATITITAQAPVLQSISIAPTTVSLTAGATRQFAVTGTFNTGLPQVLTTTATYTATGGTISAGGLYTAGNTPGAFTVRASFGGFSATANVTITAAATLTSIQISPATSSVSASGSLQFDVTGNFSNGSQSNITAQSTFSATVGSVNAAGLFIAPSSAGVATVTASSGGFTSAAIITITPPAAYSLMAGDDWQGYTNETAANFKSKGYFAWSLSCAPAPCTAVPPTYPTVAGGRAMVNLVPDPHGRFGQVARVLFPQNSDGNAGPAPKIIAGFPASDNVWVRWKMRWVPGWTSVAALPSGAANSYKIAFITWANHGNRMETEFTSATRYIFGLGANSGGANFSYTHGIHPGQDADFGVAQTATGCTPQSQIPPSSGQQTYCEWDDGEWYEFIMHYKRISATSGYDQYFRRKLTPTPGPWRYTGSTFSGNTAPQAAAFTLGVNKNKQNDFDMYIMWGPWEVVDGKAFPNPFNMTVPVPVGGW